MIVLHDELPEFVRNISTTLFNIFSKTIAVYLLICQEPQRVDQVVTHVQRSRVCSKYFCLSKIRAVLFDRNPVRSPSPSIVLTATRFTSPIALLISMSGEDRPNRVVFKQEAMITRTHARQRETPTPSLDAMIFLRKSVLVRRIFDDFKKLVRFNVT